MPVHTSELRDSPGPHILVVDDEVFIRNALELYFETHDFRVTTAKNGDEALELFCCREEPIDVAILDLVMPGTRGLDVLRRFKEIDPSVEVIIATGCGSMTNAVDALRHGAFDYITKPILDFDEDLLSTVRKALDTRHQNRVRPSDENNESSGTHEEDTGTTQRSDPSSSSGHECRPIYEGLDRLAASFAGRGFAEESLEASWDVLHSGFGADAALALRQDDENEWKCEHSWGFISPPKPTDMWGAVADAPNIGAPAAPESGVVSRPVWGFTVHSTESDESPKWARVVDVPFFGPRAEPRMLLLFFKEDNEKRPDRAPLALLGAVLSWICHHPSDVWRGVRDTSVP